jgi:transcriptional regulator with XRE-family HTH domain
VDDRKWVSKMARAKLTVEEREEIFKIANRIKDVRQQKGLSQEETSQLSGIDQTTISCIETGTIRVTLKTFIALADAFNCSVDALIGREIEDDSLRGRVLTALGQMDSSGQAFMVLLAETYVMRTGK